MSEAAARLPAPLAGLHFLPMTRIYAEQIVTWHYPDYPLFRASPEEVENELKVLLEPTYHYFVGLNRESKVVGFCCFGEDARVPGGNYDAEDALDVGLGLQPDLVGQGLGLPFLQAILHLGAARFAPPRFRATIAVFNARSRRLFERAGFTLRETFYSGSVRPLAFVILVKEVGAARD